MENERIQKLQHIVDGLLFRMGYGNHSSEYSEERKRLSVLVNDSMGKAIPFNPETQSALELVIKQIARTVDAGPLHVDINNYQAEREKLIIEIAKAAARKANIAKKDVVLPAMNAYERRLVHVELAARPDVKTESVGEGDMRHVVVCPLE
jgi:spoIIIJ-associated protein